MSANTTHGTDYVATNVTIANWAKGWRWWQGPIAEPNMTLDDAGMLKLDWPDDHAPLTPIHRDLLVEMVAELNELRILRRWVERDVQ